MLTCIGYSAAEKSAPLKRWTFERAEPGAGEVLLDVLFCGVCHSDLHQCANDWGNTVYPCNPGHEVVGRVRDVGAAVTKFRAGDIVGVGCMIDSCRTCPACVQGLENYCEGPNSWTATYNGKMKSDGTNTFGGYSQFLVVREEFLIRIPDGMDPAQAAPLLCAGVTTFSPMRHWNVGQGTKLGVAGLGGLGHIAVMLARSLGADVTVLTHTKEKLAEAAKLGAAHAVLMDDKDAVAKMEGTLDFVLSTIPDPHDVNPYVKMLRRDGELVLCGCLAPLSPPPNNMFLAMMRRSISGSLIGSIAETQEVLDWCAAHKIAPDIEVIPIAQINEAYRHMQQEEVRFRYVIDAASLS